MKNRLPSGSPISWPVSQRFGRPRPATGSEEGQSRGLALPRNSPGRQEASPWLWQGAGLLWGEAWDPRSVERVVGERSLSQGDFQAQRGSPAARTPRPFSAPLGVDSHARRLLPLQDPRCFGHSCGSCLSRMLTSACWSDSAGAATRLTTTPVVLWLHRSPPPGSSPTRLPGPDPFLPSCSGTFLAGCARLGPGGGLVAGSGGRSETLSPHWFGCGSPRGGEGSGRDRLNGQALRGHRGVHPGQHLRSPHPCWVWLECVPTFHVLETRLLLRVLRGASGVMD